MVPCLPYLRRLACSLTRDLDEAEDLAQDASLKAFRSFRTFQQGTNVRAWLSRILKTTFINEWRRRGRGRALTIALAEDPLASQAVDVADDAMDPHEVYCRRQQEKSLESLLAELPESFRTAFRLMLDGHSYREIADRLGIPMGTVMSRLHRARVHAARFLGRPYPSPAEKRGRRQEAGSRGRRLPRAPHAILH